MASGGTVKFDIEVTGYWQRCPVCEGRGIVPQGFHTYPAGQPFMATHTGPDRCQRCHGTGTIALPRVPAEEPERGQPTNQEQRRG